MGIGRNRENTACLAVIACLATVLSITWLFSLTASHQKAAEILSQPRHKLQAVDQLSNLPSLCHSAGSHRNTETDTIKLLQSAAIENQNQTPEKKQPQLLHQSAVNDNTRSAKAAGQISQVAYTTNITKKVNNCQGIPNTDYNWGEVVVRGEVNLKDSAEACCNSCHEAQGDGSEQAMNCNVWVWCGDKEICGQQYRQCWLKHLVHMIAKQPKTGIDAGWTAGVVGDAAQARATHLEQSGDRTYHVAVTAQGQPTHWQIRVHYYWYKKMQRDCQKQGVCHMGGWTRILHSGGPDDLMNEIPTHIVQPLMDKDDKGYVVLNRPWAFVQWLRDTTIPEKFVLMSEPDHIFMKPLPNLMIGNQPAAYPFFYIEPATARNVPLVERFTGKLSRKMIESIPPIGNAPTLMQHSALKDIAGLWMNVTHAIFDDEEAHKEWSWVNFFYIPLYVFPIQLGMHAIEDIAGRPKLSQIAVIDLSACTTGVACVDVYEAVASPDISELSVAIVVALQQVMEMYGFAITNYIAGIKPASLHTEMMCQPPWDTGLPEQPDGPSHYILHYTYGMDYTLEGVHLPDTYGEWRFDKRTWGYSILPMNLEAPPKGMKNYYVRRMIDMFNEATSVIPGWSEYQETSIATQWWDGKTFKDN